MCNCHSYNADTGSAAETILHKPEYLFGSTSRSEVSIDACIVDVIKHLWNNGITTHGCCCGHNKNKPSVIIQDSCVSEYSERVRSLIKQVDEREFSLLSWTLIEV